MIKKFKKERTNSAKDQNLFEIEFFCDVCLKELQKNILTPNFGTVAYVWFVMTLMLSEHINWQNRVAKAKRIVFQFPFFLPQKE